MNKKLVVERIMMLLERNMQVGWHFTGIRQFFKILDSGGILRFSTSSPDAHEEDTWEMELSKGRLYYLSTSRTKNPNSNAFVVDSLRFRSGAIVRFELDIASFKTIPVDYYSKNSSRRNGGSEYEERIISNKINGINISDIKVKRIDILINDFDKFNKTYERVYNVTNVDVLDSLKAKLDDIGISNKTYIYSSKTDFIRQTNNTI